VGESAAGGGPKSRWSRVAAAALLAGALLAAVHELGTDRETRPAAPPPSPPVAPAPRPAPAAPVRLPATTAPAPPAPSDEGDRFQGWSESVAVLPRHLGAMGPPLKLALDRVRNGDMAFCFRGLERSGEPGAESPPRHVRSSDLLLYLQTRVGAVDVVEAGVGNPGNLPPSVVDCCRDVLRGMTLEVPFVEPGRRFRYLYEVEE